MKFVQVVFQQPDGSFGGKAYIYRSEFRFVVGGVYNIIADTYQTYNSPVKVVGIEDRLCHYPFVPRTITDASLVTAPNRPKSPIHHVQFNRRKGITTVVWTDGSVTMVTCNPCDPWDEEKALALCFMKHFGYGDRGCFNEDIHKWCK